MRPLVADLMAETAVGRYFAAIPLGFSDPPFTPLGTSLGPMPNEMPWVGIRKLLFEIDWD